MSAGILMAAYFGCRPVSMFDTSSYFQEDHADDSRKLVDHVTVASWSKIQIKQESVSDRENQTWTGKESLRKQSDHFDEEHGFSDYCESESEDDSEIDDNDCTISKEKARCIRWRDIVFVVIPNVEPKKPNILLAKVTLEHTKGEDRRPARLV